MKRRPLLLLLSTLALAFAPGTKALGPTSEDRVIALPAPRLDGERSVEAALTRRRSLRSYAPTPISLEAVSQLLWSAQGVTDPRGFRTAPSAGALFPLELYLVAGNVTGLPSGIYRYGPRKHELRRTSAGDRRGPLVAAALDQEWMLDAPAMLVIGAVYERTARKYGRRAPRYVHMEAGHAVQNVYLQSEALGLGTCIVGGFEDTRLSTVLELPSSVEPLGILPIGAPASAIQE
jgi:SagB-type dehydrogenase family enzyme